MRQFLTVFRFEFGNYTRAKTFRVVTLLLVAAVLVAMSWPRIFDSKGDGQAVEQAAQMRIAVACAPGEDTQALTARLAQRVPMYALEPVAMDEAQLTQAVNQGDYDAALWLTDPLTYRYIVRSEGMHDQTQYVLSGALGDAYRVRTMVDQGLEESQANALIMAQAQGAVVAQEGNPWVKYIHAYVITMLLYMAIMIYGQLVATSVAAEKGSRAMELLITSASPTSCMLGKIFGAGLAGLTQMAAILVAAFAGYHLNAAYWAGNAIMGAVFDMPWSVFGYGLLFFVLGFFLYAALYGALGSLANRSEDINTTTLPVTLLFVIGFVVVVGPMSMGEVENIVVRIASFVPFTSSIAMFVRVIMGAPQWWEILLSVAILVATTIAVGLFSAAVYRIGVLLYGKPPKMKELIRAVRATR